MTPLDSSSAATVVIGIVLSAFVSEDGAIFGAAALASSMVLNLPSAALSAFLGLWISDFGVYGAVRLVREKLSPDSKSAQWLEARLFKSSDNYAQHRGQLALAFSRLVPGRAFLPMFRPACCACLSRPLAQLLRFQQRCGPR